MPGMLLFNSVGIAKSDHNGCATRCLECVFSLIGEYVADAEVIAAFEMDAVAAFDNKLDAGSGRYAVVKFFSRLHP